MLNSFRSLKTFESFILEDLTFKEQKYIPLFKYFQDIEGYLEDQLTDLYDRVKVSRNTLKSRGIDLLNPDTYPKNINVKEWKTPDTDEWKEYVKIKSFKNKKGQPKMLFDKKTGRPRIKFLIGDRVPRYEDIVDVMDEIGLIERTNKFIKLIPGHIRDQVKARTDDFSALLVHYKDYDDYKNNFLRKVAGYKSADVFFDALTKHIDSFKPKDETVQKIKNNPHTDIVMFEKDVLIAVIYSYKSSCEVGSSSWCISTDSSQWDYYVASPGNAQYFVWDFNKSNTDNKSKIGITINNSGNVDSAHEKNDWDVKAYVRGQWWVDRLLPFGKLDKEQKIKYVVSNHKMEQKYKIISNLSGDEKKEMVFKYPALIQYVDMKGISNEDIMKLLNKDYTIVEFDSISGKLLDLDKSYIMNLIKTHAEIIEYSPINNFVKEKFNTDDIVRTLQANKGIWKYTQKSNAFASAIQNMDGQDIADNFDLINILPYQKIWKRVPDVAMRNAYKQDSHNWDLAVKSIGEKELLFKKKIWKKTNTRMDFEQTHDLFVFNYKDQGGKFVIYSMTVIDANNQEHHQKINMMKMKARFDGELETKGIWVKRDDLARYGMRGGELDTTNLDEKELARINKEKFNV